MSESTQYDTLTGLPERGYLWAVLDERLNRIKRFGGNTGLLLIQFENLNSYKQVVGSVGIETFFKLMADRLKNCLWDLDDAVRFDPYQFVYLAGSLTKLEDIHIVMQKVLDYLSVPCEVDDYTITPSIKIGVVVMPNDGDRPDELMENAQTALHNAGSNVYGYYDENFAQRIESQQAVKIAILNTLAAESFLLMLQPKISASSRNVCGLEALIRMKDSDGNIVAPDEFLPVAETSNLMLEIGDWVLENAQNVSNELRAKGINLPISVNISSIQFKNSAALLSKLHQLAAREDQCPQNIILEVNENTITDDVVLSAALMAEIKSIGYQISIDGFGSGFSSLSVLKELTIDEIKIDRQFLSDVPSNRKNTAILISIIMLGKAMGFRVVVMGVETEAQFDLLNEFECDEFQGFLVSEAKEVGEFIDWYREYEA